MARYYTVFVSVLLAFAMTTLPATADTTDAVYSDVKGIIQELLTAEVAHSAVPELVCRAGRRVEEASEDDPGLLHIGDKYYRPLAMTHFPKALQRFYARQFPALRSGLTEEVASFAAYVVHEGLLAATSAPTAPIAAPLVDKLAGLDTTPVGEAWFGRLSGADHLECVDLVRAKFEKGEFQSSPESPIDRACRAATAEPDRMRCEIALSIRDGLLGNFGVVEERIIRVVGLVLAQHSGIVQTAAQRDAVLLATRTVLKDPDTSLDLVKEQLSQSFPSGGPALQSTIDRLGRLRTQWQLTTSAQAMQLGVLVDVLAGPEGVLADVCPEGNARTTCIVLTAARRLLATTEKLAPIIRAAGRGDVREAAHLSVQAIFALVPQNECRDEPTDECKEAAEQIEMYRRFTDAVALYVIDSVEQKDPSAGTTEAFRAAAVDVILSIQGPSGFDRGFWGAFLAPGLGLRASWNAAYGSASGDSLRYVASVNWLTARIRIRYSSSTYTALHISALDPLAPLSELALRPQEGVSYRENTRLGWNVITPRVEILFGLPGFSRHLAVGGGASLRIVAPLPAQSDDEDTGDGEVLEYKYFPIRERPFDESEWPKFVEFGFFVKYVI